MYCLYIIRCSDGTLYTGITTDVEKRFNEHLSGKGAKYTKSHKPEKIEFVRTLGTKSDALKAEYKIKKLKRNEKEELIASPEKWDLFTCL